MVKIEEKGKVTFGQAFKDYFRGYVDFKGRTTRAGYWWMTLVLSILALIFLYCHCRQSRVSNFSS